MANVKQYAMMRAMQNEEYQELHEVIEYRNERQEKLVSTMECQQKLMGEVLELRDKCVNKFGRQDLGGGCGVVGEEAGEKAALEGKAGEPKWRVERHSC